MKVRNAIGLQLLNSPSGLGVHIPHKRTTLEPDVLGQPGFLPVIFACRDWQDRDALVAMMARETASMPERAAEAIDMLCQIGVLICDDDEIQRAGAEAHQAWSQHGWSDPFVFQWHIDHLERADYAADGKARDIAMMREYLAAGEVPSNYKHVPGARRLELRRDVQLPHASLWDAITRQNDTSCPDRPLGADELSWVTYLAFGQTGTHSTYYGERLAKTSPSGGARHPTEAYLIVLDVDGIAPGAYHYDVEHHVLEELTPGDHTAAVRAGLLQREEPLPFTARAAFITGTRFERTMWRYREAFSYRSVHHDLGHLTESLRLLARALRRNYVRGLDVKESVIEPLLRLDGIEEAAMNFAIIG